MKKILMVNTSFDRGGAAKVASSLYYALNNTSDFKTYFAYGRGPLIEDKRVFRFSFKPEVYFHVLLTRFLGIEGFGTYFSTQRLLNYIKKNKFDLIHFHNLHGYYLNFYSFVKSLKKLNMKIVWTLHDEWPILGRGTCQIEDKIWNRSRRAELSLYPKSYFFNFSNLVLKMKRKHFAYHWNPALVCPSKWLANKVKNSYLKKFRVEIIPNGVDVNVFKPKNKIEIRKKLNLPISKKIILFVAEKLSNEIKGVRYFFEALKYLKNNNYLVITVGHRINLDKKFPESIRVRQFGYLSNQYLLSDVYNSADIFCITSLVDNFPFTVLEAMACGVPVIGFRVGGIPEQVPDDCGILIEPNNIRDLAEAIDYLLKDESKIRYFSENCQKRVINNYSLEIFKNKYLNLYKEILFNK